MNAIIQHSVLIVSGTQKGAAYITELLSPREFAPMTTALSGGDARRLLLRRSYDLVVINTPLPDEFGHELAEYITEKFVSGVMVIAKAELFDQVNDKMEPFGILTVQKPLSRPLFYQALHLLIATQNRCSVFDRENQKLRIQNGRSAHCGACKVYPCGIPGAGPSSRRTAILKNRRWICAHRKRMLRKIS